jgi:hypothetical protein
VLVVCDEDATALLDEPGLVFGKRPVVVLQAPLPPRPPGIPRTYHRATVTTIAEGNEEFASESTRGKVIEVEDTGHNIHEDQPEVVMDAIRDVLAGVG